MKVGINSLALNAGHSSRGIGVYTRNLIHSLKALDVEVIEFASLKQLEKVDIIHYPFFDLNRPTLNLSKKYPTVVTIHDVTPLIFPKHYPLGLKGKLAFFRQKFALRKVSAIITDSHSSKIDIEKYLKVPNKKIFNIPLAQATHFKVINNKAKLYDTKKKYQLPDTFAIYIGDVNWNKNLIGLTKGTLLANIDLVLVGKSFERKESLEHIEMKSYKEFLNEYSNNPKVHILGYLSDEDLVEVLNLAKVLLLPSFYEGFGLSILEAQTCGIPVITSRLSSMPEVAGEGALYVDPSDIDQIKDAVFSIIEENELATKLIKAGFNNAEQFTWQKTAQKTIDVYQYVCHR